jgi:hypothetical protein
VVGPKTTRHRVVAIDSHTTGRDVALDLSFAGTSDGMSRSGVTYPGGVGRSMPSDQQAKR